MSHLSGNADVAPPAGSALGALVERGGVVKICGLREPEHAEAAARAGADLLGFVFAPSRRQVSAPRARRCIERARIAAGGRTILAVGVFVDVSADEIGATVAAAGLDGVQLHGGEPPALLAALDVPVIRAVRPRPGADPADVERDLAAWLQPERSPVAFLVDGYRSDAAGGTGARADWSLAGRLVGSWPVLLAGGLDPDNVGRAIAAARPRGVDVSSGVERHGTKDPELIAAFVGSARAAFGATGSFGA